MRLQVFLALAVVAALAVQAEGWWGRRWQRRRPSSVCRSPGAMRGSMRSGCGWPYEEGEACSFTCRDGFRKDSGDESRACSGGSWSGEPLVCVYTGCDRPPYTPGTWRKDCWWPYQSGMNCTYACRDGYSRVAGNETISCRDGKWGGTPLECRRTSGCDPPPFPRGGARGGWDCDWPFEEGETCTFECRRGWEQQSGSTNTTCARGAWTGEPLVCARTANNPPCRWWWWGC